MSKKKKSTGDEAARSSIPINERIGEILGQVGVSIDPCYDESGSCHNHYSTISGRDKAAEELEELFKQYLQAELQKRGIKE